MSTDFCGSTKEKIVFFPFLCFAIIPFSSNFDKWKEVVEGLSSMFFAICLFVALFCLRGK